MEVQEKCKDKCNSPNTERSVKRPRHEFTFQGKRYRLYKQRDDPKATWWIQTQYRGRRVARSLETNQTLAAVRRATMQVIAPLRENRGQSSAQDQEEPNQTSIGMVLPVYENAAGPWLKAASIKTAIFQLRHALSLVFGIDRSEVDGIALSKLDGGTARKFLQVYVERARRLGRVGTDEDLRRCQNTANSTLCQARAVFAKRWLHAYRDAGLSVPGGIKEFVSEPTFRRSAAEYHPPKEEIIQETLRRAAELERVDLNAFLAFWLAVGCGLRRNEIARARWEWFAQLEGRRWLSTTELGKDGLAIRVPVIDWAWERLAPHAGMGLVLGGGEHERRFSVFERLSVWMGTLGWRTRKRAHELRAWIGSKVAEEHGIYLASRFLRHKDARTTQQHYARYVELGGIRVKRPEGIGGKDEG